MYTLQNLNHQPSIQKTLSYIHLINYYLQYNLRFIKNIYTKKHTTEVITIFFIFLVIDEIN